MSCTAGTKAGVYDRNGCGHYHTVWGAPPCAALGVLPCSNPEALTYPIHIARKSGPMTVYLLDSSGALYD